MIDLKTEEILTLEQAARMARVTLCSVWRWALKGLPSRTGGRVRLRSAKLGGRWITSAEALQEFVKASTPPSHLDDTPVIPSRTPSKRQRDSEHAARELAKAGI
jgi:hypothetical protein